MNELLIDVRALQDPNFRNRGIGRLAKNLLLGVPAARQIFSDVVGLIDPELPALDPDVELLFDHLSQRVNASGVSRSALLQLSPMTHSALPVARVLDDPTAFKAAIVYDFIPLEWPERYLTTSNDRIRYKVLLAWLAKYHAYFPISEHVKTDLQKLLPVSDSRIWITKGPVGEHFFQAGNNDLPASAYILVPGGEPRKNASLAVRAHASSKMLQDMKCRLVLLSEPKERLHDYRALSKEVGGNPSLLSCAYGLEETELTKLFQSASLVVVPSRSEGFSLPVIEAMASGVPIIASNIPAHRELIDDPSDLFSSDDSEELRRSIEFRFETRDGQAEKAKLDRRRKFARIYSGFDTREAFWKNFLPAASRYLQGASSFSILTRKPRIAFITPMPPAPSGIARYSAATVDALRVFADVTVYVDGDDHGSGLRRNERPVSAVPFISSGYDRVIGAVGNSAAFHSRTMDALSRNSATVIAHDSRMLGYYLGRFGARYTARLASRELGRHIAEADVLQWNDNEDRNEVTLFHGLVDAGDPLLVHSTTLRNLIAERFKKPVSYVPFASDRSWDAEKLTPEYQAHSKELLGYMPEDILVSTFGYVHRSKLPQHCIQAVFEARKTDRRIKLAFVGKLLDQDLVRFARRYDADGSWIRFVEGYVDENQYSNFLLASDVGVQLRTHGWGSVSAALMDCVAAGIPAVATSDLANAIEAPDFIARVDEPPKVPDLCDAILEQCGKRYSDVVSRQSREFLGERSFRNYAINVLQFASIDAVDR